VKNYRTDKRAAEADTIDTVREIYRRAAGDSGADPSRQRPG
jgi:hypothetical protein